MPEYKSVTMTKGRGGWGGPLTITPTDERPLIYCVTGGGIHPVRSGSPTSPEARPSTGSSSSAPFDKIAVAVIDCGGTARVGVYPMKKVLTVDVHATSPSGPLASSITEAALRLGGQGGGRAGGMTTADPEQTTSSTVYESAFED